MPTVAIDHVEVGVSDPRWDASSWDYFLSKTDLTATGFAGSSTTRSGSHSANVWRGTLLSSSVILCGTGSQPHKGRHRPKLRVYGAGTGTQRLRLKWRTGEGQWTNNDWVTLAGLANWYEFDLGLIDITEATVGAQSWEGQIEAYSSVVGDTLDVDYMKLIPAWRYCKARAPVVQGAPLAVSAYDTFDQAGAASIIGVAADLGGNWAEGGDADDFTSTGTPNFWGERNQVSDANYYTGQYALLGTTTATNVSVQTDFEFTVNSNAIVEGQHQVQGVCARYTDASNAVFAGMLRTRAPGVGAQAGKIVDFLVIYKVKAGVPTLIGALYLGVTALQPAVFHTVRLDVNAAGIATLYSGLQGGTLSLRVSAQDADLATGGTLATGKRGLYDAATWATQVPIRYYDNVIIADTLPSPGHVMNANKAFQLSHDSAITEPVSGTNWSGVPSFVGSYLKLPPAGREGLSTRVVVSVHRNDADELPATVVTDPITASLEVTPRVLLTGRS